MTWKDSYKTSTNNYQKMVWIQTLTKGYGLTWKTYGYVSDYMRIGWNGNEMRILWVTIYSTVSQPKILQQNL